MTHQDPVGALERFFAAHRVRASDGFVLAISGGVDSMVLGEAFAKARIAATVVTIDHGLRPEAADEARFVARTASERWHLPCEVVTLAPPKRAPDGQHAWARDARYAALERVAAKRWIVTAHHQDDQIETVAWRLLRSPTPGLLRGIAPVEGQRLRPWLDLPRADLARFAAKRRLEWVDDPSNADTDYTRAWLRHDLLPHIKEKYPSWGDGLLTLARHLADDDTALLDVAAAAEASARNSGELTENTLSLARLSTWPPAVRRRLLRRWLDTLAGAAVPERLVDAVAVAAPGHQFRLSAKVDLVCDETKMSAQPRAQNRPK